MSFQLARGGVMLNAADLQSSLGGRDLGVIDNLSITPEKHGPAPTSMSVRLPKWLASAVLRADPSVAVTGVAAEVFYGGDDAPAIVPKDATVRLSPFELRWP
jgi:hypothetical protein